MGFKSMNPHTPIFPLQWSFSKSCFSATIFVEIDTVCVDGIMGPLQSTKKY